MARSEFVAKPPVLQDPLVVGWKFRYCHCCCGLRSVFPVDLFLMTTSS